MSKIGKQPIKITSGVAVELKDGVVFVKNANKELKIPILDGVKVEVVGDEVRLSLEKDSKRSRSNWGTLRALIANAILGVTQGFEKTLILEGVGFRIVKEGNDLVLNLGFSHPVKFKAPDGITFEVEKNTILKVKGFDKALVGQVAAKIRSLKKPEPYKGKGFRYADEVIRRKAGKKAVGAGAA
jgi:large subunit ribosomal protein L6